METAPAVPARLDGVDCWIFDLDNTLYPAESDLFAQIDVRMCAFVSEALDVDKAAARKLQKHWFHTYGTTLRGLRIAHGIDPAAFLDYVHDIDYSILAPAPLLASALSMLPGRKLVFTNGSARHAERVLDRLDIARHFESVFDIAAADYVPKPFDHAYARLIERHRVRPASAAFFRGLARQSCRGAGHGPGVAAQRPRPRLAGRRTGRSCRRPPRPLAVRRRPRPRE